MGKLESNNHANSEVYSMGLTILSAICLEDFCPIYDMKNYKCNYKHLEERINNFHQNRAYSEIFKATVCNMLSMDENNRISDSELWEWIRPYEKYILARENFIFESAPQKIDQ